MMGFQLAEPFGRQGFPLCSIVQGLHAAFGVKRMGDLKGHFYGCVLFQIADS